MEWTVNTHFLNETPQNLSKIAQLGCNCKFCDFELN